MAFESGSSSRTTIPGSCAQPSFRKHACGSQLPHCMIILPSAFGPCMSCITHITHQLNALPQISTTSGCNIPGTMGLLNSSGRTSTIALLSKRPPTKLTSRQQKKLASGKPGTFASHSHIHNLRQLAANASIETWDKKVSWEAAKASLLFSSWLDSVFAELDLHRKPAQPAPSPSPAPSAASVPPVTSARDELRRILAFDTVEGVLSQPNINIQHLRTMMLAVLVSSRRPILRNTDVSHLRPVLALNLNVAASHLLAARALKLLALLGCGAVSLSVNVGGSKVLWFTKIASDDWNNAVLDATRIALQVPEDGFSSWARARILESKQKGQAEIVFPDLNHAAVQASLTAAVAAWTQAMAAAA